MNGPQTRNVADGKLDAATKGENSAPNDRSSTGFCPSGSTQGPVDKPPSELAPVAARRS